VAEEGIIVVDSSNVSRVPSHRALAVPISLMAEKETGRRITASIVALGIISGLTEVVSPHALEQAVGERVPAGTKEINVKALAVGIAEGQRLKKALAAPPPLEHDPSHSVRTT
jgi:Pyruvate/2-oxoacid:ferredoxin oxidoreductase gamma subunit